MRIEDHGGFWRVIGCRLPVLLLVAAGLLLGIDYELETAYRDEAIGREAIGSSAPEGSPKSPPERAFDENPRSHFVSDAADGTAFLGLQYRRPVQVRTIRQVQAHRVDARHRAIRGRLQWSEAGDSWHDASDEASSPAGDLELSSWEAEPHRYWRLLITGSGAGRLVIVKELEVVTEMLRGMNRARELALAGANIAFLAALILLLVRYGRNPAAPRSDARELARVMGEGPGCYLLLALFLVSYYNYFFFAKFDVIASACADTYGFIDNHPQRVPGYSALIDVFDATIGNWALFPMLQLNLQLASVLVLGYAISRLLKTQLAGIAFLALLSQSELFFQYSGDVLADAAAAAFATLHVACVLLLLAGFSRTRAVLAGIFLMCLAAVKSVGIVWVAPASLALLYLPGRRRSATVALLAPVLIYHLGVSSYNYSHRGFFDSTSLGGVALLGHVAWNLRTDPESAHPEVSARIEERLEPIVAKRPVEFGSLDEYVRITRREYNRLLWSNAMPELRSFIRERHPEATQATAESEIARTLARETILREPGEYALHVLAHYYGLWAGVFQEGRLAQRWGVCRGRAEGWTTRAQEWLDRDIPARKLETALSPANLARHRVSRPTLPAAVLWSHLEVDQIRPLFTGVSLTLWLVSLVGSALIFAAPRLGPGARAWCLTSLYVNAYLGATSLVVVSFLRYAVAVQGIAIALGICAAWTLGDVIGRWWRRRTIGSDPAARRLPAPD